MEFSVCIRGERARKALNDINIVQIRISNLFVQRVSGIWGIFKLV